MSQHITSNHRINLDFFALLAEKKKKEEATTKPVVLGIHLRSDNDLINASQECKSKTLREKHINKLEIVKDCMETVKQVGQKNQNVRFNLRKDKKGARKADKENQPLNQHVSSKVRKTWFIEKKEKVRKTWVIEKKEESKGSIKISSKDIKSYVSKIKKTLKTKIKNLELLNQSKSIES